MSNIIVIFCVLLSIHLSRVFCLDGSFGTSVESGSSLLGATQRKSGLEYVNLDEQRSGKESNSGFSNGESGSHAGKQDVLKYEDKGSSDIGYDKGRQSIGRAKSVDEGRNSFEQRNSGHYKKGYHRTGFTNNYRKDESGHNSSFYEDSDDEGGKNSADDNGSYYGQNSESSFKDGAHDALRTARDRERQEVRDNSNAYNDRHRVSGGYDGNQHYDDRKAFSHGGLGQRFGKNDNEHHYRREQLYPTPYEDKDYASPLNYRHFYRDLPLVHYENDTPQATDYDKNYRYFPGHAIYPWQRTYYPENKYHGDRYDRDFHNGGYTNGYVDGYHPLNEYRTY